MSPKKEKAILKYLEHTYGKSEVGENDTNFFINGVCIYYKSTKQVGWVGKVNVDLCNWFGKGRYHPELNKWFSNKYNLDVHSPHTI